MPQLLPNPTYNEFLYTALYNADYLQKRGLPGRFLKACTSERAARSFARTATKEEREIVLAHLGYEFGYIVYRKGLSWIKIKGILKKFETGHEAEALKLVVENGIYFSSDKETMRQMSIAAQRLNKPSYFLNLDLAKQGYSIKKWKKKFLNDSDSLARDVDENAKKFARLMRASRSDKIFMQGITGIGSNELDILLELYAQCNDYVPDGYLRDIFDLHLTKREYRYAIKALVKTELIRQGASYNHPEYTITGQGIKYVTFYFAQVLVTKNV